MALESFVSCCFSKQAKTKQKTMYVEWYPCGSSDPEAVSGSSTTSLNFLWKESLAKKLSIKNETEVNSVSFFEYN